MRIRPLTPEQFAELIPSRPAISNANTLNAGIRVDFHIQHRANEIALPPLDSHLFVINLTSGVRVQQRRSGESYEHTTEPFQVMLCPAGSEAFWAQNRGSDLVQIFVNRKSALSTFLDDGFEETPRLDLINRFCFRDEQVWNWAERLRRDAAKTTSPESLKIGTWMPSLSRLVRASRLTIGPASKSYERLTNRDIQKLRRMALSRLEQVRVADLAIHMGLQNDYFSRCFQKATGIRPVEFLAQLRMEQALRLIRKSDWDLARIAASCGYADQSHMTRAISGWLSEPPARLRKRERAEIF